MEKISLTPLSIVLISSILALSFLFSLLRPRKTPTPSTYPLIGNLLAFLRNRHRFLDWVSDLLSQTPSNTLEVRTLFFTTPGVCTADPANVEHLLKTNFSNYVKGPRFYTPFSDLLGDGIFNVDGRLWTHQRKIASHEFNTRSLRSFVLNAVQAEIETQLFPALLSASESGEVLDLDALLRKFTFDNICSLAFGDVAGGGGGASGAREFVRAFDIAAEICFDRALTPVPWVWKAKRFFNVGSEKQLRAAIRTVDEYAMKIIDSREGKDSAEKMDLLSRFIYAEEELISEDDKHQRRKFLRDIIISFILAGKDSTSTALTWFFWLISENPRCEKRIHEEIAEVEAARRRENEEGVRMIFGYEELKKMNYLQAAISESLRLYPPVPINSRVAVRDDVLPDGTRVGAGWFADYSAYAMGRMEKVWGAECREFVPERWLDEGEFVAADQFRFPVFHGGQRVCLGREMAYLQMKAVAAAVVGGYWVERVEGGRRREAPAYTMSLTLKMKGGFPVRMRKK